MELSERDQVQILHFTDEETEVQRSHMESRCAQMTGNSGEVLSEATLVGEGVGKVDGEPVRQNWSESSRRNCMLNPGSHVQNSSPPGKPYWLPWNLNNSI